MKELTAQQRASRKQMEKRKNEPRINIINLTSEEALIRDAAVAKAGGVKAAVMAGLRLYVNNLN